jgi:hypothetical protein
MGTGAQVVASTLNERSATMALRSACFATCSVSVAALLSITTR